MRGDFLNGIRIPWSVNDLSGDYVHINPSFYRVFDYNIAQLQSLFFEEIWGVESDGVFHRINVSLLRTGEPQIISFKARNRFSGLMETIRAFTWLKPRDGRLYRDTLFVSHAEPEASANAAQCFKEIKKLA